MQPEDLSQGTLPPFPWFYSEARKLNAQNWLYILIAFGIGGIYSYIRNPDQFRATLQTLSDPTMLGIIVVFAVIIPSLAFLFFKPAKLAIYADHMEYEKGKHRFSSAWKDMKDIIVYSGGRSRDAAMMIFRIKTSEGKTRLIDSADWSEATENPLIAPGLILIKRLENLSGTKARLEGEINGINYGIYIPLLICIILAISTLLTIRQF